MQTATWSTRFTALQLAVSSAALIGLLGLAWLLAAGDLPRMTAHCWVAYLIVMAIWVTRRVARALAAALEMRSLGALDGFAAAGRVIEAALLPLYCAALLFAVAVVIGDVGESPGGTFLQKWFAPLSYAGDGLFGMIASAIAILCIWRRQGRAGWVAVMAAQTLGAAAVAAGFFLSLPALIPADKQDTWYDWPASPPILWVLCQAVAISLGLLAVARLWRSIGDDRLVPWATCLYLLAAIGYLAGFGMLTGLWLSSWLYGAFYMARLSTYAFFLCEPKDQPILRSSWFVCYLAALALCVATTAHQVATGNFGMMTQPMLMMPMAPVATTSSFWSFSLSLMLALTRDILFLLWVNRIRPSWGDAIGTVVLVLLYGPIAIGIAILGWGFLFPVLYPLSVTGPVDLVWPLAMIGLLVALILRSQRGLSATSSLA